MILLVATCCGVRWWTVVVGPAIVVAAVSAAGLRRRMTKVSNFYRQDVFMDVLEIFMPHLEAVLDDLRGHPKRPGGRPRSLKSFDALANALRWLRSPTQEYNLCLEFGLPPATLCRWLWRALLALERCVHVCECSNCVKGHQAQQHV